MTKKSIYHVKNYVYQLLYSQGANNIISGKVYKDRKPNGSKVEDIVINSISMDNELLQDAVINVNCYVPYKEHNIGNVIQKFKDDDRLLEIYEAIAPMIDNQDSEFFDCQIEKHEEFEEEQEEMTYINFRLNLKIYNNT